MNKQLFIHKYQPQYFCDFDKNNEVISLLNMLIAANSINILLIGNSASGKTTILNAFFCHGHAKVYSYYSTKKEKPEEGIAKLSIQERYILYLD